MRQQSLIGVLVLVGILATGIVGSALNSRPAGAGTTADNPYAPTDPSLSVATFAGGCFWCVEAGFEKLPGVVEAVSGYSGGESDNPTYREVSAGGTGHTEAVQVYYDPSKITYDGLLQALWRMMDPTDPNGQFVDRGTQYRPAIFYHDAEQKQRAEQAKAVLSESGRYPKPVVIEVVPFERFFVAEEYHQDYYKKNPVRYTVYTFNSGRYQFVDRIWGEDRDLDYTRFRPDTKEVHASATKVVMRSVGFDPETFRKPDAATLKRRLTPLQFEVTQEDGTERAFDNRYWDEKRDGIYVDIVSGEPLFLSRDKYRSGTGWPSFSRPISPEAVVTRADHGWIGTRTEVRSRYADSHLGHVFEDGPEPTGLRYCMNSAAMRFIPADEMASAGYGRYVEQLMVNER